MAETLDAFRYISYMRSRWRFVAASGAAAVALAALVSLTATRQYTATARIVIDPPAGADARSAMAVSPIYLESLKTYEEFAAGDSLFQTAAERFQLRALTGAKSIESLKRSVLKVGLVRNTRILAIGATLPDAAKAHALAEFLAEETVGLNRSLTAQSAGDLIAGIELQERDARKQLETTDEEWSRMASSEPVDDLQNAIFQASELRAGLERRLADVQLEQAGDGDNGANPGGTRARVEELRKQLETLNRDTAEKEKVLASRMSRRERLEAERKADQAALTAAETRLREARNEQGYRGERLTIIDHGVVPERPSSPNVPLNLVAAALLGLLLPVVYLALALGFQQQRAESRRGALQTLAKARDEEGAR